MDQPGELLRVFDDKIGVANVDLLRPRLFDAVDQASGTVRLDMSRVVQCDSTGLKLLIGLTRQAAKQKKEVVFVNPQPVIIELFNMTRLNSVFNIEASSSPDGEASPASP